MATVVDALVVTFGIDPKGVRDGSREVKKEQDEIKKRARETGDALDTMVRKIAALLAVFTGSRALGDFVQDLTQSNAQLERLSRNLQEGEQELSSWGAAAAREGGSAAAFQGDIRGLSRQLTEIAVTGQSTILPYMRALGVALADGTGRARSYDDILLDLADRLHGMDRTTGFNIGQMLGLSEGTVNLLLQGSDAVKARLARQRELNPLTAEDARNSERLANAWFDFHQAAEGVGRLFLNLITPALTAVLKLATAVFEYLRRHPALLIAIATTITAVLIPVLVAAASAAWAFVAPFLALLIPFAGFIALVGAAAAAVALLADDWWTWLHGGDSALRGLWDAFAWVIDKIRGAGPMVRDAIRSAFLAVNPVAGLMFDKLFPAKAGAAQPAPADASQSAVDFFVGRGWTREQAIGLAANASAESGLDPRAVGDGGRAYGAFQWHEDRQAAFRAWAGKDIRDSTLTEQLAFADHELRSGSETAAGRRLSQQVDAARSAAAVSLYYERPADAYGQAVARAGLARRMAAAPAAGSSTSNDNSSATTINGGITVNTQATDAQGIASALGPAIRNRGLVTQADRGLN